MEYNVLFWIIYAIGVMVAMILFIDDAYEESWRYGINPTEYLGRNDVLCKIIANSFGSWFAVLYRWQKKN